MEKYKISFLTKTALLVIALTQFNLASAQENTNIQKRNYFWERVQFGGGLGLGFGNNFTNITVAPSAIYNFNQYFSSGLGLQYSYVKQKNFYQSNIYGGSIITLFNPIEEIQLSVELEELRVNTSYESFYGGDTENFWNTALFLGAGYRTQNVTIGARYNVLFKENQGVYANAFIPFIRVYF